MTDTTFLAGERLSAQKLQQLAQSSTYLPTLVGASSDPDLGTNPGQTGLVHLNGNLVTLFWRILWGTSPSPGSGRLSLVPPPAYPIHPTLPADSSIGGVNLTDASPSAARVFQAIADVTNNLIWFRANDEGTLTNAVPWTWAAGDDMAGYATYLTDFGAG